MGVVRVEPHLPMPGIPDAAVIEKVRRGMAGCGSCLGMGQEPNTIETGWGWGSDIRGGAGADGGDGWLRDITRGTMSILSSVFTPPAYRSVTPTSITEIRTGGGINYPARGVGPTQVPVTGLSTTTVLLLGLGVLALFAMQRR